MTAPDTAADDPATWVVRHAPGADRRRSSVDLDLAWRLVRGVTSNAIVLVRDRRLVGMGSGQTSRVDAARQAVDKAHAHARRASTVRGASAPRTRSSRSPTRSRSAWRPGVRPSSSPGGSMRDAEVVAAVDAAGRRDAHHRESATSATDLTPVDGAPRWAVPAATIAVPCPTSPIVRATT